MQLDIIDVFSILLVFVSLLFAVFLFTLKTENRTSNLLLGLFLILNAQDSGAQFVGYYIYPQYPALGMFISSTLFIQMPLLYLYILSVIYSDFKLKQKHLLHLIPFILLNVVLIPRYYGVDFDEKMIYLEKSSFERMAEIKFSYVLLHLQMAGYFIVSFIAVKRSRLIDPRVSSPDDTARHTGWNDWEEIDTKLSEALLHTGYHIYQDSLEEETTKLGYL